jgi:putative phosphoesterase
VSARGGASPSAATARLGTRAKATVGVISDTHGLLRPEAIAALAGSDLILHAGDVGGPEILARLAAIAPVIAVRGNNDRAPWAFEVPESIALEIAGAPTFMLHDAGSLDFEPAERGVAIVVAGHSHRPLVVRRDGALWINPGSAGPRRFKLPVSVARLIVEHGAGRAEIVTLL